jgi:hypothetical protein
LIAETSESIAGYARLTRPRPAGRHVLAALDQIGDLRGVVVTADALHCQRDHVAYLAARGAHWILTVKGNQPNLHQQLAGLLWRQTPKPTGTPTWTRTARDPHPEDPVRRRRHRVPPRITGDPDPTPPSTV